MENKPEGFDRANGQGKNHDTEGNIANLNNETLNENTGDDTELAQEIDTVTPDNDNEDLVNPTDKTTSNKGQGPAGENL